MTAKQHKHSNFPPIFIASTVILALGSAYKFIFGKKDHHGISDAQPIIPINIKDELTEEQLIEEEESEQEDHPQEPEEDPVQSL